MLNNFLAVFYKQGYEKITNQTKKNINFTKIESIDLDVIAIYRSNDGLSEKLTSKLQEIINMSKSTLVIGDINICNKKQPNSELKTFLEQKTFRQMITQATHIEGIAI